ncbi:hypothetical protein GCM10010401_12650 [Rarobacter faecitabidus]|uniref:NlpC/P60 family protein n=1 Tax=Rarobacter faecitabidus TaxID=13243 RepID=A0A542Z8I4_RARFA|nr:C40 family peptidase [Rarobacter faecitabidus]TQL56658.1 NlpC/P60 family protein [Rarobacter faecitabidus]
MTIDVSKSATVRSQPALRAGTRLTTPLAVAVATILGATVLAAAPAANSSTAIPAAATTAIPAKKAAKKRGTHKLRLKVRKSDTTVVKGHDRITLRIKTKGAGKKARVVVKWKGKKVAVRTMRASVIKLRLPAKLRSGKGRLAVIVQPGKAASAKGVRANVKRVRIRVLTTRQAVVLAAKEQIGVPYRAAGSTPRGFDCSGFTKYVFKDALEKNLPRTSSAYRSIGKRVSRSKAKPGDIIWSPGHVAIYLGGNKIIDAPRPGKTIQVRAMYQRSPVFVSVL